MLNGGHGEVIPFEDYNERMIAKGETTMATDDKKRGLYDKFKVKHNDDPTGRHKDCLYFVLDLDHDPHALPAIIKYIEDCEKEYPVLAADLTIAILRRADAADVFSILEKGDG